MKTTLNQLKLELKAVQQAHGQLNDFFWGGLDRAVHDNTLTYPLMCCYNASNGGGMQERLTGVSLVIVVADKVYKDYANLDDTQSDTLKVCREVYNVLNKSSRWRNILTIRSASATNFVDGKDDEITGHILTLTVDLKDTQSYCDIPMFDYDFDDTPEGSGCAGVTVINSNLTYSQLIASGDIFELPDTNVTVKDQLGNTIGNEDLPSAVAGEIVVTPLDATVTNSNNTYNETVASGSSLELPNTTFEIYLDNQFSTTTTLPTLDTNTLNIILV